MELVRQRFKKRQNVLSLFEWPHACFYVLTWQPAESCEHMNEIENLGAFTVREFCKRYRLGHTLAYEMIKDGRLRAVKCGQRTLLLASDVRDWEKSLRTVHKSR